MQLRILPGSQPTPGAVSWMRADMCQRSGVLVASVSRQRMVATPLLQVVTSNCNDDIGNSGYGCGTGSGTYHLGDLVERSATPAEGFHFVKWADDEDDQSLTRRFYLDRYSTRFYEAIMESDATYHIRAVCEPEEAGTVTGCVEVAHYEDSVELDVTPAPGWRIVEWSDDRHFDGDHRTIDVYEDLDLVVYLEEIEVDDD